MSPCIISRCQPRAVSVVKGSRRRASSRTLPNSLARLLRSWGVSSSQLTIQHVEDSRLGGAEINRSPPFSGVLLQRGLRVDLVRERPLEFGVALAIGAQGFKSRLEIPLDLSGPPRDEIPNRLIHELVLRPAQDLAQRGQASLNVGIDPVGGGFPDHECFLASPAGDVKSSV